MVARVADLQRLALAAVRHAPHGPLLGTADRVERRPERGADARVRGVLEHAAQHAVRDLPADLAAELEVEPAVVDRPRAVGLHVDALVGAGDHLLQRRVARAAGRRWSSAPWAAGRARRPAPCRPTPGPTRGAESRPDRTPTHRPSRTMSTDWAAHALVVVAEAAHRPRQRGVGGDLHQLAAEAQVAQLGGVEPRRAGERRLPARGSGRARRRGRPTRGSAARPGSESRTSVVSPGAQTGAVSSACACSAMRPRWPRGRGPGRAPSPGAELAPHPRVRAALGLAVADRDGVDHRAALDDALVDAAPSLDANHFSVSHTWLAAWASGTPAPVGGLGGRHQQVGPLGER